MHRLGAEGSDLLRLFVSLLLSVVIRRRRNATTYTGKWSA